MDYTTDILQIKIDEAKKLLTKESKEAIDAVNWKYVIEGMNDKYTVEQIDNLTTETELLLCGILNPDEYESELEKRLLLSKNEVSDLLNELDRQIFKKIQSGLEKKIFEKEKVVFVNKPLILDPRFISMPKDIQEAIAISDWRIKLYEISKEYKLNIEQQGILEDLTVSLIQNKIHPDEYEGGINSKIVLSKENLTNLVKDVNENILKNIRDLMLHKGDEITKSAPLEVESGEDVPLPPYAKKEAKISSAPEIEEKTKQTNMETEGIELPLTTKDELKDSWPIKKIETTPGIDSMPKDIPMSILEEKLKSVTMSDHTVSDYTATKMTTPSANDTGDKLKQPLKSHDPYREAF